MYKLDDVADLQRRCIGLEDRNEVQKILAVKADGLAAIHSGRLQLAKTIAQLADSKTQI